MRKTTQIAAIIGTRAASRLPSAIADVSRLTSDQMRERGLTESQAIKLSAALRLAREIAEPTEHYTGRITSPETAMAYCKKSFHELLHAVQEEFWIVTLDPKNHPIARHRITVGTLRNSLVHPREVFRPAIADAANCIIAVHNHPSGDPTPSDQDISVTERLESAAEIIGIPLIDHIVVAGKKAISIQEWRQKR